MTAQGDLKVALSQLGKNLAAPTFPSG